MENKKEFVVTFPSSEQIAEDAWRVYHPTLKVTEETPVGEIWLWFMRYNKTGYFTVQLSALDIPQYLSIDAPKTTTLPDDLPF